MKAQFLNSGRLLVAQHWQSMKCLPKLWWFVKGEREANPGKRVPGHSKEKKANIVLTPTALPQSSKWNIIFFRGSDAGSTDQPRSLPHLLQLSVTMLLAVKQAKLLSCFFFFSVQNEYDCRGTNVEPSSPLGLSWLSQPHTLKVLLSRNQISIIR